MNVLTTVIRILAIAVGACFVIASALDVMGLVPYSEGMPPLAARLRHSLPMGVGFAALLIPYRKITSLRSRVILGSLLFFLAACVFWLSIEGMVQFLRGQKSWHVVPAALAMLGVVAGNFWAFLKLSDNAPGDGGRPTTD